MKELKDLLKIHFFYDSFRNGQEKAIRSIVSGKDTVVVLPTGGGKSLIFQLPSLILEGITIVVSPLIALMKDQVDSLEQAGIPATFINSSISLSETNLRMAQVREGKFRLVYVAPERFYNKFFLAELKRTKVSLFAIDEAHCISQWGHDFRPSYLRLKEVIQYCGSPRVVALTATATPEVRADIIKQLDLKDYEVIISGFSRPNLQLGAMLASAKMKLEFSLEAVSEIDEGVAIIYVGTRSKAEEALEYLSDNGISALSYHAGMDSDSRDWVQEQFMLGKVKVIVATNAFGLGINKKDIRLVIHLDLPGTIEAYYQEVGRAGRDGKDSVCLLFYSPSDRYLQEFFISGDNPSAETVKEVYRYLLDLREEKMLETNNEPSLLITYAEIARYLSDNTPDMAIGTALRLLEKGNYVSRPNEKTVNTFIKLLDSLDLGLKKISPRAKKQKEVALALRAKYEKELISGSQFILEELALDLKIKKDVLARALKNLSEAGIITYQPPFKGTEVKILKVENPEELDLDFSALKIKAEKALDKLNKIEAYVYTKECRQKYILKYFGEKDAKDCGRCDNCLRGFKNTKQEREYLVDF